MLQTYANGSVATRQTDGVGWLNVDRDIAANGEVIRERDPISSIWKESTRDRAGRPVEIAYSDETAVAFDWPNAAELNWNRGLGADEPSGSMFYDGYGRRRDTFLRAPVGADFARRDEFDASGNPIARGAWCQDPNPANCSKAEFFDYDPFGRPGLIRRSGVDQMSYSYDGMTTTESYFVWDGSTEQLYERTHTADGFGRLLQVEDVGVGSTQTTTYRYDGLDRLVEVIMGPPTMPIQQREFCYDGLSRLRRTTEPEAGETNYTSYDAQGNLLSVTDDRSVTATSVYDCAARPTQEAVTDPTYAVERRQTYDENGYLARLTKSEYDNLDGSMVRQSLAYTGVSGRVSAVTTDVLDRRFTQGLTYDAQGRLATVSYPATVEDPERPPLTLGRSFAHGFLASVFDTAPSGPTLVSNIGYDPSGAMRQIDFVPSPGFPGPINTVRTFDSRNRIAGITATPGGFATGTYLYDRSNNIRQIGADSFGYTVRSQLESATVNAQALGYTFDDLGNLLSRTGVEPFAIAVSPSSNRITTPGHAYESNGNLAATPDAAFQWDGFNRLASTTVNGKESSYLYDASGSRIWHGPGVGCASPEPAAQEFSIRGPDGQLLSDYNLASGCSEVKWQRDYLYANGEQVGTIEATLAAPYFYGCGRGNLSEGQVYDPAWNGCRSDHIQIFRRADPGSYDFNSPLLSIKAPSNCTTTHDWNVDHYWSDSPSAGDWCYIARSVTDDGSTGPLSVEVCTATMPQTCTLQTPCWNETPAVDQMVRYRMNDHLGSPRQIVARDGTVLESMKLGPFGEEIVAASCAVRTQFTGHERDQATGLDYMKARYYGRGMARFLSVDPVEGNVSYPLSWNRYSYVLNNPLRYVDPEGLDFVLVQNGAKVQGGDACKDEGACDKDGNLIVKSEELANPDSGVTGTVNENGVQITTSAGTFIGQFIAGTPSASLTGSGVFDGLRFEVTGDSGGKSLAEGRWYAPSLALTLAARGGRLDPKLSTMWFHSTSVAAYRFGSGPFAQLGEDHRLGFPSTGLYMRGMGGFFDVDKDGDTSPAHVACALMGHGCQF